MTADKMAIDKVLLEVLNNRFTGIVEEMGYVIHRAAFTTFVKETWDFDSALVTTDGEVFSYPRNIGVTNMLSMSMKAAIECFDNYEPGDIVITNDPLTAKGMATHLPDYMMFSPVYSDGRIVCFAWCFVHSSDVGGLVPGSIAPQASDRFQGRRRHSAGKAVQGGQARLRSAAVHFGQLQKSGAELGRYLRSDRRSHDCSTANG